MSVHIERNDLPPEAKESVSKGILSVLSDVDGVWQVSLTSELTANAWDVEVQGPNGFHWERRFSGGDRDPEVISEAIRSAVLDRAA
jgi:hypothetical protein